jgi:glycosyltransferase involved in cell wall biosynthesis
MTGSITVLIPTYKRPELLRCALQSVRNQSRLDLVAEVLVSENSDDKRSEPLCREFSDLPIRFIRQSPPLDVGQHFAVLPSLASTPLVATLGDDDMWGRYHLEDAALHLNGNCDTVAYVGSAVVVRDSSRAVASPYQLVAQSRFPPLSNGFADHWVWSAKDVLLASLLLTPLNMWAVVSRRDALAYAFEVFAEEQAGLDSDRFMLWRLSTRGSLAIGREIGLFYRIHEGSGCARMASEAPLYHTECSRRYTERMLQEAAAMGLDARGLWKEMIDAMTPQQWEQVRSFPWISPGSIAAIREAFGEDACLDDRPSTAPSRFKAICRDVLPPVLVRSLARLRRLAR